MNHPPSSRRPTMLKLLLVVLVAFALCERVGSERSGFEWSGIWAQASAGTRAELKDNVPSLLQSIVSKLNLFASATPEPAPEAPEIPEDFEEDLPPPTSHSRRAASPPPPPPPVRAKTPHNSVQFEEEDDPDDYHQGWEEETDPEEEMMELHLDQSTGAFGVPAEDGFAGLADDVDEEVESVGDFHLKFHGAEESLVSEVRVKDKESSTERSPADTFLVIEDDEEDEIQAPNERSAPSDAHKGSAPSDVRHRMQPPKKPASAPPRVRPQNTKQFKDRSPEPTAAPVGGERYERHPPIVVLVHDRAAALRRLFQSLSDAPHLDLSLVTIYQDGSDRSVELVVRDFFPAKHIRLPPFIGGTGQPVLSSKLTFNYRFMMEHALANNEWTDHVIVLEDDLIVAPDFVSFFNRAAQVMDEDPSIFCASGYNDNGFESNTRDWSRVLRGQHFMALGWMLSRRIYSETEGSWNMNEIWDVPFAKGMGDDQDGRLRECIFPEVARTKHIGDVTARSGLTTSAAAQQLWFDFIHLHQGSGEISADQMREATAEGQEARILQVIKEGKPVSCLSEMISDSNTPLLFLFQAASNEPSEDTAWDDVANTFGFLGRGGGWDRLPRGFHRGLVQGRVAGNLVLFISSASPYVYENTKLKQLLPFPAPPKEMDQLVGDQCKRDGKAAAMRMKTWTVSAEEQPCQEICEMRGLKCDAGSLWAAVADESCRAIQEVLGREDQDLSCTGGCEHQVGGIHTPIVDEFQVCKIPTTVVMSCHRKEISPFSGKVCPCR